MFCPGKVSVLISTEPYFYYVAISEFEDNISNMVTIALEQI